MKYQEATLTTSPPVSVSGQSASGRLRLWPDEYEELRAEARAVVKAALDRMPSSGGFSGQPAPDVDPAVRAKAARETIRAFGRPVPEGETRELAGRHCRVFRPDRDELGAADRVAGANLVYGVYDWGPSASHLGLRATGGPDLTPPESMTVCTDAYLPGRTDAQRRDPAVSPAFADLHGLPPALLSVGTSDHLLDDILLLASRWSAAGGDVELFAGPDLPHGFDHFPCELTRRWTRLTAQWFDRVLSR